MGRANAHPGPSSTQLGPFMHERFRIRRRFYRLRSSQIPAVLLSMTTNGKTWRQILHTSSGKHCSTSDCTANMQQRELISSGIHQRVLQNPVRRVSGAHPSPNQLPSKSGTVALKNSFTRPPLHSPTRWILYNLTRIGEAIGHYGLNLVDALPATDQTLSETTHSSHTPFYSI